MENRLKVFASITINKFIRGFLYRKMYQKIKSIFEQYVPTANFYRIYYKILMIQKQYRRHQVYIAFLEIDQMRLRRNYYNITKTRLPLPKLDEYIILIQNKIKDHVFWIKIMKRLKYNKLQHELQLIAKEKKDIYKILFPQQSNTIDNNKQNSTSFNLPKCSPFKEGISFFSKIIDIDIYNPIEYTYPYRWINDYIKVEKYNNKNNTPIQLISIGTSHTIIINSKGQIFSWGWNNYSQCGCSSLETFKNPQGISAVFTILSRMNYQPVLFPPNNIPPIIKVTCGEDTSFVIDEYNTLYAFGDNSLGRLGLGHTDTVYEPTTLKDLEGRTKEIKICGEFTYVITNKNELCSWPTYVNKKEVVLHPMLIDIKPKIIIDKIACGKEFTMILTNKGMIYSFGNKNTKGELGTGDFCPRSQPEQLSIFAKNGEKMINVVCGYKHTICLSGTGKAFIWGSNSHGQLCLDNLNCYPSPMNVTFETCFPNRVSIIQIAAGFRSSFFLTDCHHILSSGESGLGQSTDYPIKVNLKETSYDLSNEKKFIPVRLAATWNNSMSIFYITFADIRATKVSAQKLNWILKTISSKWTNDSIYVPHIPSIAQYINSAHLSKHKETI